MIPSETHPSWAKLVKGEIDHKFGTASAGMLFFNLRLKYKRDPSAMKECVHDARTFFDKYQNILANDIKILFK
jgi:hypothetical protein